VSELLRALDAAIHSLRQPLSAVDVKHGWTPENQEWWLAYLRGLRDGALLATDFEKSSAPFQLARWLDYYGTVRGPLADRVVSVQRALHPAAPTG